MGSPRRLDGVVAVFIARRDHQQPKADDVGERVRDLVRRARVLDAGGHAIGDAKPLLDLAQNQNRRRPTTAGRRRIWRRSSCRKQVTGRAAAA